MRSRTKILLTATTLAVIAVTLTYSLLPSTTVLPSSVPAGTLAGATPVNVLSVDAFTRAIEQAHGTNAVLQHVPFAPAQSTGWHTHPGPNIVLVVSGSVSLADEHCDVTNYGSGQGFVTGLDVHQAVAGPNGADFYTLYFLPQDATGLRANAEAPNCTLH